MRLVFTCARRCRDRRKIEDLVHRVVGLHPQFVMNTETTGFLPNDLKKKFKYIGRAEDSRIRVDTGGKPAGSLTTILIVFACGLVGDRQTYPVAQMKSIASVVVWVFNTPGFLARLEIVTPFGSVTMSEIDENYILEEIMSGISGLLEPGKTPRNPSVDHVDDLLIQEQAPLSGQNARSDEGLRSTTYETCGQIVTPQQGQVVPAKSIELFGRIGSHQSQPTEISVGLNSDEPEFHLELWSTEANWAECEHSQGKATSEDKQSGDLEFHDWINAASAKGPVTLSFWQKSSNERLLCGSVRMLVQHETSESQTPILTGGIELSLDSLRFRVRSSSRKIERVAAWQAGNLICSVDSGQENWWVAGEVKLTPNIRSSRYLIFIWVEFVDSSSTPWTYVAPEAQESDDVIDIIHETVLGTASDDVSSLLEKAPPIIFRDGKIFPTEQLQANHARDTSFTYSPFHFLEIPHNDDLTTRCRMWNLESIARPDTYAAAINVRPRWQSELPSGHTKIKKVLVVTKQRSATEDLYIYNGLEEQAEQNGIEFETCEFGRGSITAEEFRRSLFQSEVVIVSRYIPPHLLEELVRGRKKLRALVYVLDDDFTAAEFDLSLPNDYSRRISRVVHRELQPLLEMASHVVVTSDELRRSFGSNRTVLLHPPLGPLRGDLSHHADTERTVISYLGTASHANDLLSIAPALLQVFREFDNIEMRTYLGSQLPEPLRASRHVVNSVQLPWGKFKRDILDQSAHVGLAPLVQTPYNRSKSIVKAVDIARQGSAGIFSACQPYTSCVVHGASGLLVPNDVTLWYRAIRELVENRQSAASFAEGLRRELRSRDDLVRVNEFWRKLLAA